VVGDAERPPCRWGARAEETSLSHAGTKAARDGTWEMPWWDSVYQ
jgi:hypothetical protein